MHIGVSSEYIVCLLGAATNNQPLIRARILWRWTFLLYDDVFEGGRRGSGTVTANLSERAVASRVHPSPPVVHA